MKDDLKEFTEMNRDNFELPMPDLDAAWQGIEERLDDKKTVIFPWRTAMKIAATLFLVAVVGIGYYVNTRRIDTQNNGIALHNISKELAETEAFYAGEIQEKIQMLEVAEGSIDPDVRLQLDQMDEDYNALKNDLQDRADNEEVINAMIGYYRLKLELLEKILDEIQETNEDKTNDEARTI